MGTARQNFGQPGRSGLMGAAQQRSTSSAEAWSAWHEAGLDFGRSHRVYGVAMHRAGDTIFQTTPRGDLEVVTGGGLLARTADSADIALLDRCIAEGSFMVCVQERRPSAIVLRVHPAKTEGWSVKSLHPSKGGTGTISATVVR